MDDEKLTPLHELALPWGRHLQVSELEYESGMKMLRLRFREGKHRFTIVDLDTASVAALSEMLAAWTAANAAPADGEDDGG